MERLYKMLEAYAQSDYYPFHMPGHKRSSLLTGAALPYSLDITEIDGFDDLHHAEGVLMEAEERAAELYRAEETHYLINGSTAGILSAVLGCTERGGKILMARNCHKSVYNAVFMNELHPVYVYPEYFSKTELCGEIRVSDVDRAAPHGTGDIKAGLNYAMSLHNIVDAHNKGYDENMYLDPASRKYVEETGGANFIFVTKDGKVVTPKSNSILPSITRRSLMAVAKDYLGLEVEERPIAKEELKDFAECGLCGTAAVISPVGKIVDHDEEICLPSGMEDMGPVTKKLYDTLTGIQMGRIEAPEGWIKEIL